MQVKVIDLTEVLERVENDKELLLELFDIFEQDYQSKSSKLQAAVARNDFESVKDIVHSIKGAAGNISAKVMHADCVKIEQLAAGKDMPAVNAALSGLEKNFKDLQGQIQQIKKDFQG